MPSYEPFRISAQELHERNMAALARFGEMGLSVKDGFYSTSMPLIQFVDLTTPDDAEVDLAYFAERLRMGAGILTAGLSPFHTDGTHVTLVKWGPGDDDCGRIIADETAVFSEMTLVSYREIRIGKRCLFGPSIKMFDCDGSPADPEGPRTPDNMHMAPITIEDGCWIGTGAIIMPGVTVGHHATVSAGAVVTSDVPPHSLVAGNPARVATVFES